MPEQNTAPQKPKSHLGSIARPLSQSPWPVWGVSGLFLASALLPPNPAQPPILMKMAFGAIFAGSGYVLAAGDTLNGSGISTAWSLAYILLNARKSVKPPISVASLALTSAALASSALYGTEYFVLQDGEE